MHGLVVTNSTCIEHSATSPGLQMPRKTADVIAASAIYGVDDVGNRLVSLSYLALVDAGR